MEKTMGNDIANPVLREQFIKDNCDACEKISYMKPYNPEELQRHKEELAKVSIEIAEIEGEMRQVQAGLKGRLKPLKESRAIMVSKIKAKAEYVNEVCYRFTNQETKETGYYNNEGLLVECRQATADELQPNIFSMVRKTGTTND